MPRRALPLLLPALLALLLPRGVAQAQLRAPGSGPDGLLIVGGQSISGAPAFLAQYTPVFTEYLNAALGAALNKTFVTVRLGLRRPRCVALLTRAATRTKVALPDDEVFEAVAQSQLDFVFTYPSSFTCLGAQFGVTPLATVRSLRRLPTPPYAPVPLAGFAGNFFALSTRDDIRAVADVAGRRLEGAGLTSLGSGQAQWHELTFHEGISFWDAPSQVLLSHNQYAVAADVAAGVADVGMVRTDFLEALQLPAPLCNATAQAAIGLGCFPPGTFKILNPRSYPGYPFNGSTEMYPEVSEAPSLQPMPCLSLTCALAWPARSGPSRRWRTWTRRRRRRWPGRSSPWARRPGRCPSARPRAWPPSRPPPPT
jgi:hypothetical protein